MITRALTLLLVLSGIASARDVTVAVWNGLPDKSALFYGYIALEGGHPIPRGSTLWVLGGKGMTSWSIPAVSPLDDSMTLYADFDVDPNLVYDEKHHPNQLLVPRWKTSIHCEVTVPNVPTEFGVLFVENPPGSPSKYGCIIQH